MTTAATNAGVSHREVPVAWRLYAIEAALLGAFMLSACITVVLLEHPASPVHAAIASSFVRRALIGLAMGITAIVLIYSPWGKRSGAVMNPAAAVCFLRLGRLAPRDAVGYIAGHFLGGAAGGAVAAAIAPALVGHPAVNYVATQPGPYGLAAAWFAEVAIAFVMMGMVLAVNRVRGLVRFTGVFAGILVALYITFEAPISGMSLNPARTVASALSASQWTALWIYLTAPFAGMLAAVELARHVGKARARLCGKLVHSRDGSCHLKCDCL